ncbi:MAG: hypothetical protein FK733_09340, partial [Asgard group archaeon]|nr:hypothetical protein [Asgard group archaeon]
MKININQLKFSKGKQIVLLLILILISNQFALISSLNLSGALFSKDDEMSINNLIYVYGFDDITINDSYAYCIGRYSGFTVYNITNKDNPIELPTYMKDFDTGSVITGSQIEVQNNTLYCIRTFDYINVLKAFNITNFNNITYYPSFFISKNQAGYSSTGNKRLHIDKNIAYVSINWLNRNYNYLENTFALIDIKNNSKIELLGLLNSTGYIVDFAYENNFVYVIQQERGIYNKTTEMYETRGENLLQILNVTDKHNPELIYQLSLDHSPETIIINNSQLIISSSNKVIYFYYVVDYNFIGLVQSFSYTKYNPCSMVRRDN